MISHKRLIRATHRPVETPAQRFTLAARPGRPLTNHMRAARAVAGSETAGLPATGDL